MIATCAPLSAGSPAVSPIALGVMKWGTWGRNLSPTEMLHLIEIGLEHGLSTFDHADIYGHYTTEAAFGEAIAGRSHLRQRIQLITKCGICMPCKARPAYSIKHYNTSAAHIRWSVEQSLRQLRTDYLDVLLIHRPDPLLNPQEVATTVGALKQEGKLLAFGVSNFSPAQFALLHACTPLVTNQVKASAMHLAPFTDGTFDQCLSLGIRPMAWSPLGGEPFFTEPDNEQVSRLRAACAQIAQQRDRAEAEQIMLAFLLRHPAGIVPVIGTANPERICQAAQALHISLSQEEWCALWSASTGQRVP